VLAGESVSDGIAIVRLRKRGTSRELVVCDVLLPEESDDVLGHVVRSALRVSGADYALRIGGTAVDSRFFRLPRQGPILTWRDVRKVEQPRLSQWALSMGDVELL
jgi:hypothetical protein